MVCHNCNIKTVTLGNVTAVIHELGCASAHTTEIRECKECGNTFTPDLPYHVCCSDHCYRMYNGLPCDCDDCSIDYDTIDFTDDRV